MPLSAFACNNSDFYTGAVSKVGYFLDSLSSLKLSLYIIMT